MKDLDIVKIFILCDNRVKNSGLIARADLDNVLESEDVADNYLVQECNKQVLPLDLYLKNLMLEVKLPNQFLSIEIKHSDMLVRELLHS
jgi:hypothetical protein